MGRKKGKSKGEREEKVRQETPMPQNFILNRHHGPGKSWIIFSLHFYLQIRMGYSVPWQQVLVWPQNKQ